MPGARRRSSRRTRRSSSRSAALGVSDELLDTGLEELAAVMEGCASVNTDRFQVVAEPEPGPRAGLLHGHRLRDLHGRLREPQVGRRRRPLRRARLATARRPTRASASRSASPGPSYPCISRGVLTRRPVRALGRPGRARRRGVPGGQRRGRPAAAGARHRPPRWPPPPQKFGKQIRYAERRGIPYVWFPGADGAADQVKDIRSGDQVDADPDTWTPPAEDLRPRVVSTCPRTQTSTRTTKEQDQ